MFENQFDNEFQINFNEKIWESQNEDCSSEYGRQLVATKPESELQFLSELEDESNQISPLFEDECLYMPEFNIDLDNLQLQGSPKKAVHVSNCFNFEEDKEADVFPMGLNFKEQGMDFNAAYDCQIQCDTPKSLNIEESYDSIAEFAEVSAKKSKSLNTVNKVKIQVKAETESLTSEDKKKRSLALRADVMNKNLFRAIRRECKTIFEAYLATNILSNSRSKRIYKSNLKKFSQHLLDSTNIDWRSLSDFSITEFTKYLGIFINTCLMKKIFEEEVDQEKVNEFNNLLYSYSHKKFYDYISKSEVSTVIKLIFEQSQVTGFVAAHPTLSVNPSEYEDHVAKMLRHI